MLLQEYCIVSIDLNKSETIPTLKLNIETTKNTDIESSERRTIEINKLETHFNHSMKNFCSFYFFELIDRERDREEKGSE